MMGKAGFLWMLMTTFFVSSELEGQVNREEDRGFYGFPMVGLLASQIDGDQAGGYNHFGYQLGMATGFRFLEEKKLDAVEMQFCLVERGSRRAFDPLTMVNAFHIKAKQLEIQLAGIRRVKTGRWGNWDVLGGLRFTRLIRIVETEGYNPGIASDFAKNGLIFQFAVGRRITESLDLRMNWDYSVVTALANPTMYNPFYPTGVYHNGIGVSAVFRLGQ